VKEKEEMYRKDTYLYGKESPVCKSLSPLHVNTIFRLRCKASFATTWHLSHRCHGVL